MPAEIKKNFFHIMEVCGTHTMAIAKYGLRDFFPETELVSGPGCPVCVTPAARLQQCALLSRNKNIIMTVFGDMIRVPALSSSLEKEISAGADIRVVYSAYDSIKIAQKNPGKEVVFAGAGFETTAPLAAAMIFEAERKKMKNLSLFSMFKSVFPAMETLLSDKEAVIDGLILPGNVASITGAGAFRFIARKYGLPCAVAGFSGSEIISAVGFLIENIKSGKRGFENMYKAAVSEDGNLKAKSFMDEVFCLKDGFWRGFGQIKKSVFGLKAKYAAFDADKKFAIEPIKDIKDACLCGDIMKGKINPRACALFGKKCTPLNPLGPCMVSSEGVCSAYYKYG